VLAARQPTTLGYDSKHFFVYGSDVSDVTLSEDQSGATSKICLDGRRYSVPTDCVRSSMNFGVFEDWGDIHAKQSCVSRLQSAANFATNIKRIIREKTGFSVCLGVSVSPMLSKIAAGLKKPDSITVLYPWRSSVLVEKMPLRSIPDLGAKTFKLLESCLQEYAQSAKFGSFWTCRDLLHVPHHAIASSLSKSESSSNPG